MQEVSELVNKMEITKNEHLNSQKKLEESQQEVVRLQEVRNDVAAIHLFIISFLSIFIPYYYRASL